MRAGRALVLLGALVLAGCASTKAETLDQLGHFGAGKLIASDAVRWTTPEAAVEHTMTFARAREDLQHPGECGDGCRRDLAAWRAGAEAGAGLGQVD